MIQPDKKLHFIAWLVITLGLLFTLYYFFDMWQNVFTMFLIANAIAFTFGIGKEVYDCFKKSPTGFSWGDMVADVIGILIADGIMIVVLSL